MSIKLHRVKLLNLNKVRVEQTYIEQSPSEPQIIANYLHVIKPYAEPMQTKVNTEIQNKSKNYFSNILLAEIMLQIFPQVRI